MAKKIYVADAINNRIQVFDEMGNYLKTIGRDEGWSLQFPYDLAKDAEGHLYTAEYGSGRVTKFNADGTLLGRFGKTGTGKMELRTPWGLAVNDQHKIIITDTGNHRMVVWSP